MKLLPLSATLVISACGLLYGSDQGPERIIPIPVDGEALFDPRIGMTVNLDDPYCPVSRLALVNGPEAYTVHTDHLEVSLSTTRSAMEEVRERSIQISANAWFCKLRASMRWEDMSRTQSSSLALRFWRRTRYVPKAAPPTQGELAQAAQAAAGQIVGDHVIVGIERLYAFVFTVDLSQVDEETRRDLRNTIGVDSPYATVDASMMDRINTSLSKKTLRVTVECIGGTLGNEDVTFEVSGTDIVHKIAGHTKVNPPQNIGSLDDAAQTKECHPVATAIHVRPLAAKIPFDVWNEKLETVRPIATNALFARYQAGYLPPERRQQIDEAVDAQLTRIGRRSEVYGFGDAKRVDQWVHELRDGDRALGESLIGKLDSGTLLGLAILPTNDHALVPSRVGEPVVAALAAGDVVRVTGQLTYYPLGAYTNLLVDAVSDAPGPDAPRPKLLGGVRADGDGRAFYVMEDKGDDHHQVVVDVYYEIPASGRYRFGVAMEPHSSGVGGPNCLFGGSLRVELAQPSASRR